MARDMSREGFFISLDMCAATSYLTNPYDVVNNPRHQATASDDQPEEGGEREGSVTDKTTITTMAPQPWTIIAPMSTPCISLISKILTITPNGKIAQKLAPSDGEG